VHTNVARLQDVVASRPDADLAVFPELFLGAGRPEPAVDYLRHARGELPVRSPVQFSPSGGRP
jgi:predicted amidohydrolase